MNAYDVTIYFGHKVKVNLLATEKMKNRILHETNDFSYRPTGAPEEAVATLSINHDFIQFIQAEPIEVSTRFNQDLNKYGIASVMVKE